MKRERDIYCTYYISHQAKQAAAKGTHFVYIAIIFKDTLMPLPSWSSSAFFNDSNRSGIVLNDVKAGFTLSPCTSAREKGD